MQNYLNEFSGVIFQDLEIIKVEAEKQKIPLVSKEVGQFLYLLTFIKKPKVILEIGFGSGYSTLWMARGNPNAKLISFEKEKKRYEQGLQLIQNYSYPIELINDDVRNYLKKCSEKIDFLFIDGVKSQYLEYLQLSEPHLNPGAVVFGDNLFYRGKVFEAHSNPKKTKEIELLEQFTRYLTDSVKYDTVYLPVSDGISFSVYKGSLS